MSYKSFLDKNFFGPDTENPCFIAESPALKDLFGIVKNLSQTSSPVLIQGEKGVGKRSYAFQIFLNSESGNSDDKKFYILTPENFSMSRAMELPASYLFFRHIETFSPGLQKQILDFLKENFQRKLGIKTIFSTVCGLDELVECSSFNPELYARISSFTIRIPPLRERKEDLLSLSEYYLNFYRNQFGKKSLNFSESAEKAVLSYRWPGNAAEMKCVIKRACLLEEEKSISSKNLFLTSVNEENGLLSNTLLDLISPEPNEDLSLKNAINTFKKAYIFKIMEENGWNQTRASKVLDIQRTYLTKLIGELDIKK